MKLSWRDIGYLTSFPCLIAAGQILFKLTAAHAKGRSAVGAIGIFLVQPAFYGALAVYGFATLWWLWLLSRYSLTLAYPFVALTLVLVPLVEVVCFGVHTTPGYWMGLALVIAGVLLVTRSQASR